MNIHELAFDASPDALLVVDMQGRILRMNVQVSHQFGYGPRDLLGRQIEVLVPDRSRRRHVAHREAYTSDPLPRPMGANLDLFAVRKDGTEFPVDIMLSPIDTQDMRAVLCVVRDVTSRRKAEEKFRALLESAPDAMVIADEDGRIVLANAQAERIFGYTRSELLRERIEVLIPERYRAQHPEHRGRYFANPGFRPMGAGFELFGRRRDGSEFPVEVSLSPLHTEEGTLVSSAIRDISERKEADRLLELLKEKDVLLKEVHHRVKNNLAVISSLFYLQSTYTQDSRVEQVLREGQARVRCMAQVHERLYRSDSLSSIDFGDYATGLCQDLLRTYVRDLNSVRLRTQVAPVHLGLDMAIPCGLILNELMTNSVLHGYPDGRPGVISVSLSETAERTCVLRVEDDGVGIADLDAAQQGASLGLRLIRALTRQLKGTFELSALTPGTAATLSFPITEMQ